MIFQRVLSIYLFLPAALSSIHNSQDGKSVVDTMITVSLLEIPQSIVIPSLLNLTSSLRNNSIWCVIIERCGWKKGKQGYRLKWERNQRVSTVIFFYRSCDRIRSVPLFHNFHYLSPIECSQAEGQMKRNEECSFQRNKHHISKLSRSVQGRIV